MPGLAVEPPKLSHEITSPSIGSYSATGSIGPVGGGVTASVAVPPKPGLSFNHCASTGVSARDTAPSGSKTS